MSSSLNGDQDSRKSTNMEESSAMTIEFLRARLLSERSVSKSARQRADELAKRVSELEEELKFVSLQRKKAEKATADVLAILENRGISDVSEDFDSNSDRDESTQDFKSSNGSLTIRETSTTAEPRTNGEAYSSSEIESSSSAGRSLAWKSTKDSQHSLENNKYMESVRRRASFTSCSSGRRVGKSCRRIRRRETRSMEDLENDGSEKALCTVDASNCSDGVSVALRDCSGYVNGKDQLESTTEASHGEAQKINGHFYSGHERDDDMESALQHQAQLIGRYEEEEKAQREWEEKFRESENCTQESYDPGNHSDVTEERYEMEVPKLSQDPGTLDLDNEETNNMPTVAQIREEPPTSKNFPSPTDADHDGNMQDEKCNSSEFSFPTTKEKNDHEFLVKQDEAFEVRQQQHLPYSVTTRHPSPNISLFKRRATPSAVPGISSSLDVAVMPRDTSNNLGSVLEALQRAKLSLTQTIHHTPFTGESSSNGITYINPRTFTSDSFKVPIISPGLFRLPTDIQFEATTLANPGVGVQASVPNHLPEIAPGMYEPTVESRIAFSSGPFHTAPYRSSTPDFRPGAPPHRSFSQPRLDEGTSSLSRLSHHDPYTSATHPTVADTYPYLPDITLGVPLKDEGTSRAFSGSESGLPPLMRLSPYSDRFRPNMQ